MVKVKTDITGWKLCEHGVPGSRLVVIRQAEDYIRPNGRREARWLCQCTCGSEKLLVAFAINLMRGLTLSCGCVKHERTVARCKKYNKYNLSGDFGIGIASNCDEEFYFDLEDYEKIYNYCWYKDFSTGYMKTRTVENKWIFLHRFVTDNKYQLVDHINHNKLDDRKSNLRDATRSVNSLNKAKLLSTNTSGITGVSFSKKRNRWWAQLCVNNVSMYLGSFINKDDAIRARLKAEAKYYKEFAPQRHLFAEYNILEDDLIERTEEKEA